MNLVTIIILSVIQGLAELLPVSSSAHVIAAAKWLKLDPTTPEFGFLLVMLHCGTMLAVIVYFWRAWKKTFFHSQTEFVRFSTKIIIATGITGALGLGLKKAIEHVEDPGYSVLVSWRITEAGTSASLATNADSAPPPTAGPATQPATLGGSKLPEDLAKSALSPVWLKPRPETLLTHIYAADRPDKPLFNEGDVLTLTPKNPLLEAKTFHVEKNSTLEKLLKELFSDGFKILPGPALHGKNTEPGVVLSDDPKNLAAVQIRITGNDGSANRLEFKDDVLLDQEGRTPIRFNDINKAEVEHLFKRMDLIAYALAGAGLLILFTGIAGRFQRRTRKGITTGDGFWIGVIQGLTLPFRGFSRSGATISLGLLRGLTRARAEEFSFALAVALTPPVMVYEAYRLIQSVKQTTPIPLGPELFMPGIKGMAFSFLAGLIALKLLSKLLEKGQWWLFGVYCLAAASGVWWMHMNGFGA